MIIYCYILGKKIHKKMEALQIFGSWDHQEIDFRLTNHEPLIPTLVRGILYHINIIPNFELQPFLKACVHHFLFFYQTIAIQKL